MGQFGFRVVAISALAFGLGAPLAVFWLVNPILFSSLPYDNAQELVSIDSNYGFRLSDVEALKQEKPSVFYDAGAYAVASMAFVEGAAEVAPEYKVTVNFLSVLGIEPIIGRPFAAGDAELPEGTGQPALITHKLWKAVFFGREDVVGSTLRVTYAKPASYVVIGVLPPEFLFPDTTNPPPLFLLPLTADFSDSVAAIGRIRHGVGTGSANAMLATDAKTAHVQLFSMTAVLFKEIRAQVLLLFIVMLAVWLLMVAGLSHLLVSRLAARRSEFVLRACLGATPRKLAVDIIGEPLAIVLIGAVFSLLVSYWTHSIVIARAPRSAYIFQLLVPRWEVGFFLFWLVLVLLTLVALILVPLGSAVRHLSATQHRVRSVRQRTARWGRLEPLLIAHVCFATLIIASGLSAIVSYQRLVGGPLGFNPFGLLLVLVEPNVPPSNDKAEDVQRELSKKYQLAQAALEERWPGSTTLMDGVPGFNLPLSARSAHGIGGRVPAYSTSHNYTETLGVRLVTGRSFTAAEVQADANVAVLDERAARLLRFDAAERPHIVDSRGRKRTVVGVTATLRTRLGGDAPTGVVFIPLSNVRAARYLLLRPGPFGPSAEAVTERLHAGLPSTVVDVSRLAVFERTLGKPRFIATVMAFVVGVGLLLAMLTTGALVNRETLKRRDELTIRAIVGATPMQLAHRVLASGLMPAGLGMLAGFAIYLAVGSTIASHFGGAPVRLSDVGIAAIAMLVAATIAVAPTMTIMAREGQRLLPEGERRV